MQKKSFLLGIGLGMIFTSLLFLVAYKSENYKIKKNNINAEESSISDDEIIERAKSLGMTFYVDLPDKEKEDAKGDETEITSNSDTQGEVPSDEEINSDNSESEPVEIVINSGANATNVSKILFDSGLIDDAEDFKNYIVNNKKSTKIRTGKYYIPKGLSYDDIISYITKEKS